MSQGQAPSRVLRDSSRRRLLSWEVFWALLGPEGVTFASGKSQLVQGSVTSICVFLCFPVCPTDCLCRLWEESRELKAFKQVNPDKRLGSTQPLRRLLWVLHRDLSTWPRKAPPSQENRVTSQVKGSFQITTWTSALSIWKGWLVLSFSLLFKWSDAAEL